MKPPIRAVVGNLVWNRTGQVWAVYAVEPVGSLHASHSQRIKVFNRLRSAFMKLPTEAHLLSIGETVDPFDVLTSTLPASGVLSNLGRDLQQRYEGYLTSQRTVRRTHYVALLLDRVGSNDLRSHVDTAMAAVTETLGATSVPSPKVVQRCERRAAEMAAKFGSIRLVAVTPGRIRWLSARLLSRGVDDVMYDESWEPRAGSATTSLTGPFQEVRFLEGGDGDDEDRGRVGRYVRCDTAQGSGFHTCLVLSDMPTNWRFPGDGELLAELESAAEESERGEVIEADISIRIRRIDNAKARKKTKGKQATMVHQRGEYDGSATGAPDSLDSASDSLRDLRRSLENNKAEPELECTVIVHLADASLERLERHAESLRSQFEPANYGLVRPIGDQMKLLSMAWPGSPAVSPVRDYRQHLLARDLASMLPFNASGVGDDRGGLFAVNLDSGVGQPVHFDPSRGPMRNMPGNWAAIGEPGAGKSASGKRAIELVIVDGGQVVTIDRTEQREYVRYAVALSKMGAQALLYLVAAYMRRATFANRGRFAMAVIDEFWGLKSSPYGRALIDEWVRDSRKHNAAVAMFSQHADDFDESVRSFLGTRMVFRQRTPKAAAAALAFLDVTDDEMVERLVSSNIDEGGFASGTCLLRDLDNRVGLVQVHQSFNPYLREASDTNPTDATASAPTRRQRPSVAAPAGV